MEIKTKYNVGDTLYLVDKWNESERIDCVECSGTGKVKYLSPTFQTIIDCPCCRGSGSTWIDHFEYSLKKGIIDRLHINVYTTPDDDDFISYHFKCGRYPESVQETRINSKDGFVYDSESKAKKRLKELQAIQEVVEI